MLIAPCSCHSGEVSRHNWQLIRCQSCIDNNLVRLGAQKTVDGWIHEGWIRRVKGHNFYCNCEVCRTQDVVWESKTEYDCHARRPQGTRSGDHVTNYGCGRCYSCLQLRASI